MRGVDVLGIRDWWNRTDKHRERLLRLTHEEIEFFIKRVVNSKLVSARANSRTRFRIMLRASIAAIARKSCIPFAGDVALMDHSDREIAKLTDSLGLPWNDPVRNRIPLRERLLAGLIAFTFALINWPVLKQSMEDNQFENRVPLAEDKFVTGSVCFAQLLARAFWRGTTWHETIISGDLSFKRMFAAFASNRLGRPISVFLRHRRTSSYVVPIVPNRLFTADSAASKNFRSAPHRVLVVTPQVRQRTIADGMQLVVGIVVDNNVSINNVWTLARHCAEHENVKRVLVRLHPGSPLTERRQDLPPSVVPSRRSESLAEFAESIDFAFVSGTSAVPALQELLVPCFHTRMVYSPDDIRGRAQPSRPMNFMYPTPELEGPLTAFLNGLTVDALNLAVEDLRAATMRRGEGASLGEIRAEVKIMLRI